jgi:transposase
MIGKTRNSSDFINHLRNIRRYVRKRSMKRFILVIDNASFHISKKTKRYIETQSEWLTAVYLPKRSPLLNPVETKVNRNLKKDICANHSYETKNDLLCSMRKYLGRIGCWPKI